MEGRCLVWPGRFGLRFPQGLARCSVTTATTLEALVLYSMELLHPLPHGEHTLKLAKMVTAKSVAS